MVDICMGFEVHQPLRVNRRFKEELAKGKSVEELFEIYFDNPWNEEIIKRVARKCYLPANEIILENIQRFKTHKKQFKVAYSISGVLIDQCKRWVPEVIESFKRLAETGCVEFLDQTYYHSLASLFSAEREEFVEQVLAHKQLMKELFDYEPKIFENTEFIYNNSIAKTVAKMGYRGIFTECAYRILGWRSPNYVYKAKDEDIKVLLRNFRLSDDVAFRFSAHDWTEWPLTANKYSAWLAATPGQCINIFVDYETFGEHQWPETGIHDFLRWLPGEILKWEHLRFVTPSELLAHEPVGEFDVYEYNTVSWADVERSTNAWLGNDMQRTCYHAIKELEQYVRKTRNEKLIRLWRLLQLSDHIYYMYTEPGASGMVHGYFSQQYPTEAFHTFTNILSSFQEKVSEHLYGEDRLAARSLRLLPPAKAFYFYDGDRYVDLSAHSLVELGNVLALAPESSVHYHLMRGDFEKWVRFTIGDEKLADEFKKIKMLGLSPHDGKTKLVELVKKRYHELRVV